MGEIGAGRAKEDPGRGARLEALVLRYRDPLVSYFVRKGLPRDVAEDCTQEVFLRLARTDQEAIQNAEAYLFTIASSVMISHARMAKSRRRAHHVSIDNISLASGAAGPDRVFEGRQALLHLSAAMSELPPETLQMFLLNREDGLTYTQIAARYGVSVKVVERHLVRALAHLRLRLSK